MVELVDYIKNLEHRVSSLETLEVPGEGLTGYDSVFTSSLLLPRLRAFWPTSSVFPNGDLVDLSGQARTLVNNNTVGYGVENLVTYATLNGTTHWFSSSSGLWNRVTGAITFGGWVRFANSASTGAETLIAKFVGTGNQRSYALRRGLASQGGVAQFFRSTNGSATLSLSAEAELVAGTWYQVIARFTPGTEWSIFVNSIKVTEATVDTTIFDSTAIFGVGSQSIENTAPLAGDLSRLFLCSAALSDEIISAKFRLERKLFGV